MSDPILSLGATKLDYWGRRDTKAVQTKRSLRYVHLPAVSEPVYAKGSYVSLMDCHYKQSYPPVPWTRAWKCPANLGQVTR